MKDFMKFTTEKGYNKAGFDFKKFKVFREDGELIYLTEDELMTYRHWTNVNHFSKEWFEQLQIVFFLFLLNTAKQKSKKSQGRESMYSVTSIGTIIIKG